MNRAPYHFGLLQRMDGRPVVDEVDDVVSHLGLLLNMKRGYGSFVGELGLSISDTMWEARPMATLAAHISEQIALFEPRLREVQVDPDGFDEELCPLFRIYGAIGDTQVCLLLSLHTVYCTVHVLTE